jgi:hypothetical protein
MQVEVYDTWYTVTDILVDDVWLRDSFMYRVELEVMPYPDLPYGVQTIRAVQPSLLDKAPPRLGAGFAHWLLGRRVTSCDNCLVCLDLHPSYAK